MTQSAVIVVICCQSAEKKEMVITTTTKEHRLPLHAHSPSHESAESSHRLVLSVCCRRIRRSVMHSLI
jgi:hypothetical protein